MSVAIHERIEDMRKRGRNYFPPKTLLIFLTVALTEKKMVKSQFFRQKIVWLLFPRNILDTTLLSIAAKTTLML